jgi:hypothetical protein
MVYIVQTNTNNSKMGIDMLIQAMKELKAGIAVVAEPHLVNNNPCWLYSSERKPTVGIFWCKTKKRFMPMQFISNGKGFVCVK